MQNAVDVETRLAAKPGRASGAQGHFQFQFRHVLASGQRADKASRLTRQIVEGGFQGLEPAHEVRGRLQAIGCVMLWRRFAAP